LRVTLANQGIVDEAALKRLGARGLVRPTPDLLQVVVGPIADQLAGEIRRNLRAGASPGVPTADVAALASALGGAGNIRSVEARSTRLLVRVADDSRVDVPALAALAIRGFARPAPGSLHLLIGPGAAGTGEALARLATGPVAR
jgi:PTS system N-acetylglucosamine-specific IIC component